MMDALTFAKSLRRRPIELVLRVSGLKLQGRWLETLRQRADA
jgi:hypothetical protein